MSKATLYLVSFISFIGFTAIIFFVMSLGIIEDSRLYTIPLRVFSVVLMIVYVLLTNFKPSYVKIGYFLFFSFFLFYFFKVILEIINGNPELHMPGHEFILYSIMYAIIPFLFFSQKKKDIDYETIFNALYYSGVLFTIVSFFYYTSIKLTHGNFDRFHSAFDPIIISYNGALLIGICAIRLITDREYQRKRKLFVGCLFGAIPFLIGGSRGPILSLILPLAFAMLYYNDLKIKFSFFLYIILAVFTLSLLAQWLGSLSFERLFNLQKDLAEGTGEVIRLEIWFTSINQFLNSPIWGDSIQKHGGSYPHNLILEVLMSTGIIGFIPYFILLLIGLKRSVSLIKIKPSLSWIFIFFFISLLMGMLSGNLSSDIYYWSSLALVYSVNLAK